MPTDKSDIIHKLSADCAKIDLETINSLCSNHLLDHEKKDFLSSFYEFHKEVIRRYKHIKSIHNEYPRLANEATKSALKDLTNLQTLSPQTKWDKLSKFSEYRRDHLYDLMENLADTTKPSPFQIIPLDLIEPTKDKVLIEITRQINGCYTYNFADACLVMMRRLLETLIIKNFLIRKDNSLITKADGSNYYMQLGALINQLLKYDKVTLTSHSKEFISKTKEFADISAHNPLACLSISDIDNLHPKYRALIGELLNNLEKL
ncbi:MAG: hypothetical protein AABX70_01265 [Nanoarchaeota archaeon]